MSDNTLNTTPDSVTISEDDLNVLRQAHSMVANRLVDLGSNARQLELIKQEAQKLIEAQQAKYDAAHTSVEEAERVFQGFMTMVAQKYAATSDKKPQIDLTTGVITFG